MNEQVFLALSQAARQGEPVVLGLISNVKGSSPQKLGAKAVFYADGRIVGTLGGGCLEAEIQQRAIRALKEEKPAAFDLLLDHDFGWDDGLICGGKVEGLILPNAQRAGEAFWGELAERKRRMSWGIKEGFAIQRTAEVSDSAASEGLWLYREEVGPAYAFWVAGAGHIAQAVAPLAAQLDFSVTVFDDRPALANQLRFPPAVRVVADVWENLFKFPLPDVPAFGLIVTRGHRHDALVLREWIHKPFLFLGMIGSGRKARTIFEHFRQEGLASEEELQKVACPVGLKIQSQTVMEIAVSIMAQFIQKRAELVGGGVPVPQR